MSGGAVRRLTFGNVDLEPSWSPTGTWIVFLRIDSRTRASGIWLVRPDGSGLHQILRRLQGVTDPVWSPRGDRLVVSDGQRLLVVAADGSRRRVVARLTADAKGGRFDPEPAWSPAGEEVVFVQARPGTVSRADLWVVRADASGLSRLTRSPGLDLAPSWGP
jgi:TolB protein